MDFSNTTTGILRGIDIWTPKLISLSEDTIMNKRNNQNRTIKQILGHMVDSASNNTHRIVHLQYQESPFNFPNYATNGNNDRWIAIQNFQDESWEELIQHWKFIHIHLVHVINNVNQNKLKNEWISGSKYGNVTLKDMIVDLFDLNQKLTFSVAPNLHHKLLMTCLRQTILEIIRKTNFTLF